MGHQTPWYFNKRGQVRANKQGVDPCDRMFCEGQHHLRGEGEYKSNWSTTSERPRNTAQKMGHGSKPHQVNEENSSDWTRSLQPLSQGGQGVAWQEILPAPHSFVVNEVVAAHQINPVTRYKGIGKPVKIRHVDGGQWCRHKTMMVFIQSPWQWRWKRHKKGIIENWIVCSYWGAKLTRSEQPLL